MGRSNSKRGSSSYDPTVVSAAVDAMGASSDDDDGDFELGGRREQAMAVAASSDFENSAGGGGKAKKRGIFLVLGVILILLVAVPVALTYSGSNDDDNNKSTGAAASEGENPLSASAPATAPAPAPAPSGSSASAPSSSSSSSPPPPSSSSPLEPLGSEFEARCSNGDIENNVAQCKAMCSKAACCSILPNDEGSCLGGNERTCLDYHRKCQVLKDNAIPKVEGDAPADWAIEPAPANLAQTCAYGAISTSKEAQEACEHACFPNLCCYDNDVALCLDEDCKGYSHCLNLAVYEAASPDFSFGDGFDDEDTDDDVVNGDDDYDEYDATEDQP